MISKPLDKDFGMYRHVYTLEYVLIVDHEHDGISGMEYLCQICHSDQETCKSYVVPSYTAPIQIHL